MKKMHVLLATSSVLLGLAGCSLNQDTEKKQETAVVEKKEESVPVSTNPKATPVMLEQKEVKQIELVATKLKATRTLNKEEDLQAIITGLEHATKKQVTVDKKMIESAMGKMTVKYQDNTSRVYFVWLDETTKTVKLGYQKAATDTQMDSYTLNKEDSAKIGGLLLDQEKSSNTTSSTTSPTQNSELDIRETIWKQLSQKSKDETNGSWKDATIRKVKADKTKTKLTDTKYEGKDVYEVLFKPKSASGTALSVFADMATEKIIGYGK